MEYKLSFITEDDFEKHVAETLSSYNDSLKSINLEKFNSNVIDPIKLLFDKNVYRQTYIDVIKNELQRQRDKSNTNAIGYFHQNMFKYIDGCEVPEQGWDVIVDKGHYSIFVEMKNKHNTMNSSSSQKTYSRMLRKLVDNSADYCYLVEAIAPKSRNIPWKCSIDGESQEYEHIRRVSMDQFYMEVTGVRDAFYQLCMQLPITINKMIDEGIIQTIQEDTVIDELHNTHLDTMKALYLLAFETYEGFDQI